MINWKAKYAMKNASDYLNCAIFELQNAKILQKKSVNEFDQFDADEIEYLINCGKHIRKMIEILTVNNNTIRECRNAEEDD